jgi:hypothetical protein
MPDTMQCKLISWRQFHALARQLALRVRQGGFRPDLIVAIGRGGYLPARVLSDYLGIFDLTGFRIEHYRGAHKERLARVRDSLTVDITGKRVLLVDDVSDTGDTFVVALGHLQGHGEPAVLKTAVLQHKTVSDFTPDFYAELVREWCWITYPWALMEDLRGFLRDMPGPAPTVESFAAYLRERYGIEVNRQSLEDVLGVCRSSPTDS